MSDTAAATVVDTGATGTTVETPPSFDDTLQGEIDRLFDASEKTEKRQERANGQDRGVNGQFKGSDAQPNGAQAQQQITDQIPEAPASWSDDGKKHWATLSPEVRQYLIDRDGEDQKSRAADGERLKGYESLERIIGPRREALAKNFQSADVAIEQLFALSDFAGRDFPAFIRFMCEQRGVDPKSLIEQVAAQPSADPNVTALQRKVAELEKDASQRGQAEEQELERQALKAINDFKGAKDDKGNLLRPHFDAVSQAMGPMLKAGMDLERAYKAAVASDDKLQAKIAAEAEKARKAKEDEEAKEKASKARRVAGSDLRSSTAASSASRASFDDTLRASIDAALSKAAS